jgi:hypothetical protein
MCANLIRIGPACYYAVILEDFLWNTMVQQEMEKKKTADHREVGKT